MFMPIADTEAQFEAVQPADLVPGVRKITGRDDFTRFEDGSLPVYAVGDTVLKLYPPVHRAECALESGVLQAIEGKLSVPTPKVHQTGELDGWAYLLMSRLHGRQIGELTSQLGEQLGEALAQLHSIETDAGDRRDWTAFMADQQANCVQRQRKLGLDERWAEQIPEFLEHNQAREATTVLLHTEIMSAHLLVHNGQLSGLFDFEPAMHGAPEYEFAAVGPFLSCGDGDFLKAMLTAYGYTTVDEQARRRLLMYFLLHRYGNLRRALNVTPTSATTLEELADHWWHVS
jgi:hygromycin-B 7''-O-kinase